MLTNIAPCACIQFTMNLPILRFHLPYISHIVLLWLESRVLFLFTYILQCISLNVKWVFQYHGNAFSPFADCTAAKLQKIQFYNHGISINYIVSCFHSQVFCCLGRCLVGFWKGYFNQKRCRRRYNTQICFQCGFCRIIFSILIKVHKSNFVFK